MTRRGWLALAAWAAFLTLANIAWLRERLPQRPPNWDRALYLSMSVRLLHAQQDGGLAALADEFVHGSSAVAPFFALSTLPVYLAAGESRLSAHATTSLYLAALLAATYALGRRLAGPGAGPLAAFALSTFPGVTLASRDYLMDFPAAALATASVALLVQSDFGRRRLLALGFGALCGLTLLTKTMAVVFLAAPVAEAGWRARKDARAATNLGASLLLALLVAACWWVPNHAAAIAYLRRYGFGPDALPFAAGGAEPLALRNLLYYPAALVNEGIGPLAAGLLALSLPLAPRPSGFLLRWLGFGLAILTAVPNKSGDRYILGLLPALALLTGGAIARMPAPPLRRIATGLLCAAGLYSHLSLTYDLGLPRLYYHLHTGLLAVVPARTAHDGRAENPWPIEAALDAVAAETRARLLPSLPAGATGQPAAAFVRDAFLRMLRREPDAASLQAYASEIERGSLSREGLVRAIAASSEFATRPARVLVLPDHAFFNAGVLRYYAERARLALAFEHPERPPQGLLADHYDAAIVKRGGEQGPSHTTAVLTELRARLHAEAERWREGPARLACPDASEIVVLASKPAW